MLRQFAVQWADCKKSRIAPLSAIIIVIIIIIFNIIVFLFLSTDLVTSMFGEKFLPVLEIIDTKHKELNCWKSVCQSTFCQHLPAPSPGFVWILLYLWDHLNKIQGRKSPLVCWPHIHIPRKVTSPSVWILSKDAAQNKIWTLKGESGGREGEGGGAFADKRIPVCFLSYTFVWVCPQAQVPLRWFWCDVVVWLLWWQGLTYARGKVKAFLWHDQGHCQRARGN